VFTGKNISHCGPGYSDFQTKGKSMVIITDLTTSLFLTKEYPSSYSMVGNHISHL
jgi:hypothetical protein